MNLYELGFGGGVLAGPGQPGPRGAGRRPPLHASSMTKNMELFKQDSELGPLFSTISAFGKLQAMRTELEEKVAKATREKNLAA